jgi:hypothetical protein
MRSGYLAFGFLALSLAACGDDDDGGGFSSGLPRDKVISGLDASEAQKLCLTLVDGINESFTAQQEKRITCTAIAFPLSVTTKDGERFGDVAMCQKLVDRCVDGEDIGGTDPDFEFEVDSTQCDDSDLSQVATCEATVGEYEDCIGTVVTSFQKQYDLIDCKQLADLDKLGDAANETPDLVSSPACMKVDEKCPDAEIDDDDSASADD